MSPWECITHGNNDFSRKPLTQSAMVSPGEPLIAISQSANGTKDLNKVVLLGKCNDGISLQMWDCCHDTNDLFIMHYELLEYITMATKSLPDSS